MKYLPVVCIVALIAVGIVVPQHFVSAQYSGYSVDSNSGTSVYRSGSSNTGSTGSSNSGYSVYTKSEVDSLTQKLNELLKRYESVKGQLQSKQGTSGTSVKSQSGTTYISQPSNPAPAACSFPWNRTLTKGSRGDEVSNLQKSLKAQGYFTDEPTGYFGTQTEAAVQRFQKSHGIVSSGTSYTTGYGSFGTQTRSVLGRVCSTNVVEDDADDDEDDEEENAEVSLEATPTSGDMPLSVVFTIEGEEGKSYTLDFGDRTTKKTVKDEDTITHIYKRMGEYTAKLLSRATTRGWQMSSAALDSVKIIVGDEDEDEEDSDTEETETPSSSSEASCTTPYKSKSVAHGTYVSGYSSYFWQGAMPLTVVSPAKQCQDGVWKQSGYCKLDGVSCTTL